MLLSSCSLTSKSKSGMRNLMCVGRTDSCALEGAVDAAESEDEEDERQRALHAFAVSRSRALLPR